MHAQNFQFIHFHMGKWENRWRIKKKHILLLLCTLYGIIYSLNVYKYMCGYTTPDIHQNIYSLMVKKIEFSFQFRYEQNSAFSIWNICVWRCGCCKMCTCGQQYSKFLLSLSLADGGLQFIIILDSLNIQRFMKYKANSLAH